MYVCTGACVWVQVHVCVLVHVYVYALEYMCGGQRSTPAVPQELSTFFSFFPHVPVCVCMCIYVCIYVYAFVYYVDIMCI